MIAWLDDSFDADDDATVDVDEELVFRAGRRCASESESVTTLMSQL